MQSSGTSTPAGDSPGPGRAFLRKTDFTPEIAPPRLRRTTYPAGQSPLVLPGLTRASSSFTITSNHQNILPLWPAAPPPGQPVVFFIRCLGPVLSAFLLPGGMVCPRGKTAPHRDSCGPRCRHKTGERRFPPASWPSMTRQPSDPVRSWSPASRKGRPSCTACPADTSGVRQALAGPVLPPRSFRTLRVLAVIPRRRAVTADMAQRLPAGGLAPFLCPPVSIVGMSLALSACCAAGERQGSHEPHRLAIRRHKKRRPPAW